MNDMKTFLDASGNILEDTRESGKCSRCSVIVDALDITGWCEDCNEKLLQSHGIGDDGGAS